MTETLSHPLGSWEEVVYNPIKFGDPIIERPDQEFVLREAQRICRKTAPLNLQKSYLTVAVESYLENLRSNSLVLQNQGETPFVLIPHTQIDLPSGLEPSIRTQCSLEAQHITSCLQNSVLNESRLVLAEKDPNLAWVKEAGGVAGLKDQQKVTWEALSIHQDLLQEMLQTGKIVSAEKKKLGLRKPSFSKIKVGKDVRIVVVAEAGTQIQIQSQPEVDKSKIINVAVVGTLSTITLGFLAGCSVPLPVTPTSRIPKDATPVVVQPSGNSTSEPGKSQTPETDLSGNAEQLALNSWFAAELHAEDGSSLHLKDGTLVYTLDDQNRKIALGTNIGGVIDTSNIYHLASAETDKGTLVKFLIRYDQKNNQALAMIAQPAKEQAPDGSTTYDLLGIQNGQTVKLNLVFKIYNLNALPTDGSIASIQTGTSAEVKLGLVNSQPEIKTPTAPSAKIKEDLKNIQNVTFLSVSEPTKTPIVLLTSSATPENTAIVESTATLKPTETPEVKIETGIKFPDLANYQKVENLTQKIKDGTITQAMIDQGIVKQPSDKIIFLPYDTAHYSQVDQNSQAYKDFIASGQYKDIDTHQRIILPVSLYDPNEDYYAWALQTFYKVGDEINSEIYYIAITKSDLTSKYGSYFFNALRGLQNNDCIFRPFSTEPQIDPKTGKTFNLLYAGAPEFYKMIGFDESEANLLFWNISHNIEVDPKSANQIFYPAQIVIQ